MQFFKHMDIKLLSQKLGEVLQNKANRLILISTFSIFSIFLYRVIIFHQRKIYLLVIISIFLGIRIFLPNLFKTIFLAIEYITLFTQKALNVIILSIVYIALFVPIATCIRFLGADLLKLKRNSSAQSYFQPVKAQLTKHDLSNLF